MLVLLANVALADPSSTERALGPGHRVETSEPLRLRGVVDDLCTTGDEVHCGKPVGAIPDPPLTPAEGSLDEAVLRAVILQASPALRACAVTSDPSSFVVVARVDADGRVSEAGLERTEAGRSAAEACLLSRFTRLVFPPPAGSGSVSLRWTLHVVKP